DCLRRRLLPRLGDGLKILDLGAGVGWLSHRLAGLGHHTCAVDLSLDDQDGLGAARHFSPSWPRLQAEFDRLPIASESVDAVLYNSSLHYSTDYRITLGEALRVLRPDGWLAVLESPLYRHEESGRRMAAQRQADFKRRYGTPSDAIPSLEFLTWGMLDELANQLGIQWKVVRLWYGLKWALRPWKARLRGTREPARFVILLANKR
ncbi:MAG: class I SAM-dependent methyltransferase, partial [Acidobacteriota bacterium]